MEMYPCLFVPFTGSLPEDDPYEVVRRWLYHRVPEPRRQQLLARMDDLIILECPAQLYDWVREDCLCLPPTGIEEQALYDQAHTAVLVRVGACPGDYPVALGLQSAAARALAAHLGGVVLDPVHSCLRPLDERCEAPPEQRAEDLIRVLSSESNGRLWVTSVGLAKVGLPELELRDGPVHLVPVLGPLVKRLGAALIEQVAAEGWQRPLDLWVEGVRFGAACTPQRPDMLTLHPPGAPAGDVGPQLVALARELDLLDDMEVIYTPPEDPEIAAAVAESRAELPDVRRRFREGLEPFARLEIRAQFGDEEGGESMCVCVDAFTRHQVRGRLLSHPRFTSLRSGQRVRVPIEHVLDWTIEHPDGRREGGRLEEILLKRLSAPPAGA